MSYPCVIIESPYNGTPEEIAENVQYVILAMRDCLKRGEAPFASHLMYTRVPDGNHISDDEPADKTVVYTDRGISRGMKYGIANAEKAGREIEYRYIKSNIKDDGRV